MKTPIQSLAHLRKIKGFSQKELAHKIGIVRTLLSRIESGRVRPSRDEVHWIAEALSVPEAKVVRLLERTNTVLWTPKSERQNLPIAELVRVSGWETDDDDPEDA